MLEKLIVRETKIAQRIMLPPLLMRAAEKRASIACSKGLYR